MNKEYLFSIVLIILAVLLVNPFSSFMPGMAFMTTVGLLVAVTALFLGVVWKEQSGDERDALHRMLVGRIAFIAGVSVLVFGIAVESFQHSIDIWLVVTLVVMVIAKVAGHTYAGRKK